MKTFPKVLLLEQPLEITSSSADVPLLPLGPFSMTDGRVLYKFSTSEKDLTELADRMNIIIGSSGLSFDVDHFSLSAWKADKPPQMVGSSKRVEVVAGVGLVAKEVKWNAFAKAAIDSHEFKRSSPVVFYDMTAQSIVTVVSVGLTNLGLVGQAALKAFGAEIAKDFDAMYRSPLAALSASHVAGKAQANTDAVAMAEQLKIEQEVCSRMGLDHSQVVAVQLADLSTKIDHLKAGLTNQDQARDDVLARCGITRAQFDAAGKTS